MQAYNIFVKRKEVELKQLLEKMEKRNADGKFMDQKLRKLEIENLRLKASEFKTEKENELLRDQVR